MAIHNWGVIIDWSEYSKKMYETISGLVNKNPEIRMQSFDPNNEDGVRLLNKAGKLIREDISLRYGLWDQIDDMEQFIDEVSEVNPNYEMWYETIDDVKEKLQEIEDYAQLLEDVDDTTTEAPEIYEQTLNYGPNETFGDILSTLEGAVEQIMPKMTDLADLTSAAQAWDDGMWEEYERGGY